MTSHLNQRVVRKVTRAITRPLHTIGLALSANDRRIKALKGCHSGRRAFIIANGPSLKVQDLDLLKNEITFASNKIFLAFDSTEWRPTYYFACDKLVGINNADVIKHLGVRKIISDQLREYLEWEDADVWLHELPIPSKFIRRLFSTSFSGRHPFSDNSLVGVYGGGTVLYLQMQMAYYMGISEVILLGLDFSFKLPEKRVTLLKSYGESLVASGEINHFHPNYRAPGEVWGMPDMDAQRRSFSSAMEQFRKAGRSIVNASRATKCEVFPLRKFEEIL